MIDGPSTVLRIRHVDDYLLPYLTIVNTMYKYLQSGLWYPLIFDASRNGVMYSCLIATMNS
jgi:hypothetical protein